MYLPRVPAVWKVLACERRTVPQTTTQLVGPYDYYSPLRRPVSWNNLLPCRSWIRHLIVAAGKGNLFPSLSATQCQRGLVLLIALLSSSTTGGLHAKGNSKYQHQNWLRGKTEDYENKTKPHQKKNNYALKRRAGGPPKYIGLP